MPMEMVLNELSLQSAPSVYEARARMDRFIEMMQHATKRRIPRLLHTDDDVKDIELAPNYPVRRWLNDNEVDFEARRYFRLLAQKAPLLSTEPLAAARAAGMDCFYHGERAKGLLATFLIDGLAVSMCSADHWNTSMVDVECEELSETGLERFPYSLYHASYAQHISQDHAERIRKGTQYPDPKSGEELWSERDRLFPGLEFCESTGAQLNDLGNGDARLEQVLRALKSLDTYIETWSEGAFDGRRVRGPCSEESNQTLQRYSDERTFLCPDGTHRLFSWHYKLITLHWRVHFYPDEEQRKIIIGYVGRHLQTITLRS